MEEEKEYLESKKIQVEGKKRKSYENVVEKTQNKRVQSVVQELEKDPGLEEAVLDSLKERKKSEDCNDGASEEFKLAVLSLMKTLNLSEKKLDDLRFWIQDMLRRGMDLSKIPHFKKLRETTIQEMLPDRFSSSTTGATIPIISHLHLTVRQKIDKLTHCNVSTCQFFV